MFNKGITEAFIRAFLETICNTLHEMQKQPLKTAYFENRIETKKKEVNSKRDSKL